MQCVVDGVHFRAAVFVDAEHLECAMAAHEVGTVELALGYEYQRVGDIHNIVEPLTFVAVPAMRIESVVPAAGPLGGGTVITVTGSHFAAQTDGVLAVELQCAFKTSLVGGSRLSRGVWLEDTVYVDAAISQDGRTLNCSV